MSSVDERVVKMRMENKEFMKASADSQKSLADLNKAADSTGGTKGLLDMGKAMDTVSVKAGAMQVATITAISNIANRAVDAGINLAKSLTLGPVQQGFAEYESLLTKQNVIMNATGKSAKEVKGYLNELNRYSDQTIYSFADMTGAIVKFTNAGVGLDTAVVSMKGIANAAAFAGANSEEAGRAMTAFSQAIGTGFMGLQDWMQIENANMGTVRFKNELLAAAEATGSLTRQGKGYVTSSGKFVSATKGWREGLQEQWLTSEALNTALGKYADESTKLGAKAKKSATEIRTFTAFMDTLKESLGSGWATIFTSLFGNLEEATVMWTGLSDTVSRGVGAFFDWTGGVVAAWRAAGGAEAAIQTLQNILAPFGAILGVIAKAWGMAFPKNQAGSGLAAVTKGVEFLTRPLAMLADLISGAVGPLTTMFKILDIIKTVVVRTGEAIGDFAAKTFDLGEAGSELAGSKTVAFFKDLGEYIGDAVDEIQELLEKGESLKSAFSGIDLPDLSGLGGIFSGLGGSSSSGMDKASSAIGSTTSAMGDLVDSFKELDGPEWSNFGFNISEQFGFATDGTEEFSSSLASVGDEGKSFGDKMGDVADWVGEKFSALKENFSMADIVSAFNTAILATLSISVARFFNAFSKGFSTFASIGENVDGVLEETGGAIKRFGKAMAREALAKIILNTAIAIGILAASLWLLSTIPMDKLGKALFALGGAAFILNRTVKAMDSLFQSMAGQGLSASINMIAISVAIMGLGAAMLMLAIALRIMDKVDWTTVLAQIGMIFALTEAMKRLGDMAEDSWKQILAAGASLVMIAGAMMLLATALLVFDKVSWESMGKAGAALAGITLALTGLVALAQSKYGAAAMAAAGAGFAMAATGMIALATALIMFDKVSWESLGKAGAALAGLAVGLTMMVVGALAGPGMLMASVGLNALAMALMLFDNVNYDSIMKMTVAMAAFALGLAILTPVLYLAAPALFLFGLAIASLGLGLLAFAAAMTMAIGLAALGTAALGAMAIALVSAIALFLQNLALQSQAMKESVLTIIQTLIDTVVESVPMVIDGFNRLIEAIVRELQGEDAVKEMEKSGDSWIERLGDSIMDKIPDMVEKGTEILVAFLEGLEDDSDDLAAAGTAAVVAFIEGIDGEDLAESGLELIAEIIVGIFQGMETLVTTGYLAALMFVRSVRKTLESDDGAMGTEVEKCAEAFVDIGVQVIAGLAKGLTKGIAKYSPVGMMTGLMNDLVSVAKKIPLVNSPAKVFIEIGQFMVDGLTIGIQNRAAASIAAMASVLTGQIAVANRYLDSFTQQSEQRAIAAQAEAGALAIAADRAAKEAKKTKKNKKDDKKAKRMADAAEAASDKADRLQAKADAAAARAERAEEFQDASFIEKAQMRAEDATNAVDRAKQYELGAATARAAAEKLEGQIKGKVNTEAEKRIQKQIKALRQQARDQAAAANAQMAAAKTAAADALAWQVKAGQEAAKQMQIDFDAEAEADAKADAYEKMSDEEKVKYRREEAARLKAEADKNLAEAKKLALTDLEKANEQAQLAMDQADQARDYLAEAEDIEERMAQGTGAQSPVAGGSSVFGTVTSLDPTDAAAISMGRYEDMYDMAAAASSGVANQFYQYNYSPESLSAIDIYRNTNNQLTAASAATGGQ